LEGTPFFGPATVEVDVETTAEEAAELRGGKGGLKRDEGFDEFLLKDSPRQAKRREVSSGSQA
jgi:hypothetical protein